MVMGMGMRTIWITLRAMNYTDRAFTQAVRNLKGLSKAEKELRDTEIRNLQIGRMQIQTGMLYAAVLGMAAGQIWSLMQASEANAMYMSEFNDILKETKLAFADTFIETLKPVLEVVKSFLNLIKENAPLRWLVVLVSLGAMALVAMNAAYIMLNGQITKWMAKKALEILMRKYDTTTKNMSAIATLKLALANTVLSVALWKVALAAGAGFAIFFALKGIIGALPAALLGIAVAFGLMAVQMWMAAGAVSVLTAGMAAIAGAAALGAVIVMAKGAMGGLQVGTRALPYTGYFFGHKGEMVFNPTSGRPVGIRGEAGKALGLGGGAGESGASVTNQDIDINIEHLHTEAPYDEVDEKLGKRLRRNMRNNR